MIFKEAVSTLADELAVPGVSVAVLSEGQEIYAFHGVTSVENPLPVDAETLFQFGSTGKTYTATAIMRLVERGEVDLEAPVRRYVPELRLADEDAAATVTVLQLLNHTAGWEGDLLDDTGEGDDALARYVELMAKLRQERRPGTAVSYNNSALSLAGRLIEKVTGKSYETALGELVLGPLGLDHTFFFLNDIATRRFVVGHTRHDDGRITIARPFTLPRGGNPAGGMSANAADQLAWARFHLGDGTAPGGTRLLSAESVALMQQPTATMEGSALGDAVGISWMLKDLAGLRLVAHGGTTIGQHSEFVMVPERGFAFVSMTNCGPNGPELNEKLQRFAFAHFLGVSLPEEVGVSLSDEELAPFTGRYETLAAVCELTVSAGRLLAAVSIKPETLASLGASAEEFAQPPMALAMLAAGSDRFVVPDGPGKGMQGYFTRDAAGAVDGVHLGGRLANRVAAPAPA